MQDLKHRRKQADTVLEFARLSTIQDHHLRVLFDEAGLGEITPQQSRALMVLFQARTPLTARELSRRMGCSEVTMSRFVKALVHAEWVARTPDPEDGRAFLLRPTPKAREAFPRFVHISNLLLDQIFAGFSTEELDALESAMERIRRNLDETRESRND